MGSSVRRPTAADDGGPVDAGHELLDFRRGLSGRIACAHERADARSGDAVDRDVQLLEHLQRADVRAALGAAAREHEPDARPRGRCNGGIRNRLRGGSGRECRWQEEGKAR